MPLFTVALNAPIPVNQFIGPKHPAAERRAFDVDATGGVRFSGRRTRVAQAWSCKTWLAWRFGNGLRCGDRSLRRRRLGGGIRRRRYCMSVGLGSSQLSTAWPTVG
jgi:hypothetical protein